MSLLLALTGSVAPPPAPLEQVSGGYEYLSRKQSARERKDERIRLGIESAEVAKAAERVARVVVAEAGQKAPVQHLTDELPQFLAMLEFFLNQPLPPLVGPQMQRQIQLKIAQAIRERDDEEAILLLM